MNTDFIAEINEKNYIIKFIPFKEEYEMIDIDDDYILIKESNGVKMKISFINKNELEILKEFKKSINMDLKINNCYISIIGDNYNKNKRLKNYSRNEILLFVYIFHIYFDKFEI